MPDQLDYLVRQLADLQARLADLERSDPLSATGYPALSGLTTGQPLRATSATAAAFGALDLANANAVTSALPHGKGGTGLSATPTNGQLPIGNGSGYALAALTGTANQVTVTNGAGTITLSTPQNIHTGATPTFAGINLGSGTGGWSTFTGTLADDASLTLTNLHGFFYIREHTGNQLGFVRAGYGGTPVVISSGFTINTADTDGNWCFFHNGSHYVLKNRNGGSRNYTVHALSMS